MLHVGSRRIAATVAVMACLLLAQGAAAAQEGVRVKFPSTPITIECAVPPGMICVAPSPGNMAAIPIKVAKSALPTDGSLCIAVDFEGDLLDEGESLYMTFSLELGSAFGVANFAEAGPIDGIVSCVHAGDEQLAALAAKKPTLYLFVGDPGSVTITNVEAFVH